jgi:hypothetical protein
MKEKKFQRRIEDFTCIHCGQITTGNGYTNHCPACLYSLHVDIHPGDRSEKCGGIMVPIGVKKKSDQWIIQHRCKKCSIERSCKTTEQDIPALIALSKKLSDSR